MCCVSFLPLTTGECTYLVIYCLTIVYWNIVSCFTYNVIYKIQFADQITHFIYRTNPESNQAWYALAKYKTSPELAASIAVFWKSEVLSCVCEPCRLLASPFQFKFVPILFEMVMSQNKSEKNVKHLKIPSPFSLEKILLQSFIKSLKNQLCYLFCFPFLLEEILKWT